MFHRPREAWSSLQALNHDVTLGWFIRALHGWGSNFMIAIVLIHMVQVFLFGAYKFPRELTWIVGVFLLLMTLGMAFSGQVLALRSGRLLGARHRSIHRKPRPHHRPGGGEIAARRTDHCRSDAVSIFRAARLRDSRDADRLCVSSPADGAEAGDQRMAHAGTSGAALDVQKEYHELTKNDGAPFVPYAVWKDLFFAAFILLAVAACALYFGPFGPTGQPGSDDHPDRPET